MKNTLALFSILPIVIAANYKNYKLITVRHHSNEEAQAFNSDFKSFAKKGEYENLEFDWSLKKSDIVVDPEKAPALLSALKELGVDFKIADEDVETMIKEGGFFTNSQVMPLTRKGQMSDVHNIQFDRWNSLENINTWLKNLEKQHDFISLTRYSSYESRDQYFMAIQKAGEGHQHVVVDCGIHAREWLSPASCVYIIDQLLNSPKGQHYIDNLNIHIVPVLNSDGYVFTNSTSTRMWRKNRNPEYSTSSDPDCVGVDLNRNFDYHWGGYGTTDNPCDHDQYRGPRAFSEVELQNLKSYLDSLPIPPILSLSIHCCLGWILLPYSYDYNVFPENYEEIVALGKAAATEMSKVGREYEAHSGTDLYPASGTSSDWYIGKLGARFGYTIEMQGKFLETESNIIPTAKETWAGFATMLEKMIELSE